MQTCKYPLEAISHAQWNANTYGVPFAVIAYPDCLGVLELSEVNIYEDIVEICHATEALRCSDFNIDEPGDEERSIAHRSWRIPRQG
jgi:hypothetical protein